MIIENGKVFKVEKIGKAISKTYVGPEYKFNLNYDAINGEVLAEYQNYLGELQVDFIGDVIFDFDGEQLIYPAIDGIAICPFEIIDSGSYLVTTRNEGIGIGKVIING